MNQAKTSNLIGVSQNGRYRPLEGERETQEAKSERGAIAHFPNINLFSKHY